MNRNIKQIQNRFTYRILMIKLAGKELKSGKSYTILLVLMMLATILSPFLAISTLMNDVRIRGTGRIATAAETITAYKSEIRGVFVHCMSMDNPNWDLIAQTLMDYKINAIYGELMGFGFGYYGDSPWGDQLGLAIKACHSRGIKFHVCHTFFYVTEDTHPELHAVNSAGNVEPYWICPTKQGTRDVIKQQIQEVFTNYPGIDGYMFDYIRYDTDDMCYCPVCKARFELWLGETIIDWSPFAPGGPRHNEFMEWRVIPITEIVASVRQWILEIKPNVEFSIAAWTLFSDSPIYWRYWIGQDTTDWVAEDYLDVVAPMMYTDDVNMLEDEFQTSSKYMVGGLEGKIPLACFLTTGVEAPLNPSTFKQLVDKARAMGADGWIIWRYGGPGDGYGSNSPDIRNYLSLIDLPDVFSLTDMQVSAGETQANITWITELPATSKVEYSTSPLFTASFLYYPGIDFHYWDVDHTQGTVKEDITPVTNHSITLAGLQKAATYYFRVQSQGPSGIATSKVLTFATKS